MRMQLLAIIFLRLPQICKAFRLNRSLWWLSEPWCEILKLYIFKYKVVIMKKFLSSLWKKKEDLKTQKDITNQQNQSNFYVNSFTALKIYFFSINLRVFPLYIKLLSFLFYFSDIIVLFFLFHVNSRNYKYFLEFVF